MPFKAKNRAGLLSTGRLRWPSTGRLRLPVPHSHRCQPSELFVDRGLALPPALLVAADYFKEELQDFDMSPRLVQIPPPRVQAVTVNQKAVLQRILRISKSLVNLGGQCGNVLSIRKNRQL